MIVDADGTSRSRDLPVVILRLRGLLARVTSGEVVATPGFAQRLAGSLVALEIMAAGQPITVRTLVTDLIVDSSANVPAADRLLTIEDSRTGDNDLAELRFG